MNQKSPKILKS